MQEQEFSQIFDLELIRNNSVLIDERSHLSCDFLLFELAKHLNFSIFQFNDSAVHLKMAFSKLNGNFIVNSIYNGNYSGEDIVDDVFTQKRLENSIKPKVGVFRSNTAKTKDYYDYDFVMIINKLKSGCSGKIDGTIKLIKRDQVLVECKYKVNLDKIHYFK